MPRTANKLLLVGCGKMGGALLRGIVAAQLFSEIAVVKPSVPYGDLAALPEVTWLSDPSSLDAGFVPDVVMIAVKPQMIAAVLPAYARFKTAVFLSIAVGTTLPTLGATLQNPSAALVRAMPNLPASIGQGATAAVANAHVTAAQRDLCDRMLRAAGLAEWVDDEKLIDVVAAVSGSGPAYVCALAEAMEKAGHALGLSASMAARLARQTIVGSGALLAVIDDSPADLRRAVTSPKGTTEAALKVLQADAGLDALLLASMRAAIARANELAKS